MKARNARSVITSEKIRVRANAPRWVRETIRKSSTNSLNTAMVPPRDNESTILPAMMIALKAAKNPLPPHPSTEAQRERKGRQDLHQSSVVIVVDGP